MLYTIFIRDLKCVRWDAPAEDRADPTAPAAVTDA